MDASIFVGQANTCGTSTSRWRGFILFDSSGLHTIRQLRRRNDLMMKVDPSDFYMHFLIGKADSKYMPFMWEGKKYQCISMPFGPAPASRLATKMMAPVLHYLRSCGLRLAIYIDDLILLS